LEADTIIAIFKSLPILDIETIAQNKVTKVLTSRVNDLPERYYQNHQYLNGNHKTNKISNKKVMFD